MRTPLLNIRFRVAVAVLMMLTALAAARAQDSDPPGRVARFSEAQGSVSLQPAGVQDWVAASLNRPLTTGDRLWTDQGARAELDLGAAVVRLGASTGFSFLNLDDGIAQMQLTAGTLIVRVRDLQPGQTYEIDTPNLALTLQEPGDYRVEVDDSGDATLVKVSEGSAQATGHAATRLIGAQQQVRFTGMDALASGTLMLGAPDELDGWSAARERQLQDSPSREYVAEDIAGTQDLDDNGRWEQTPDYGYVWTPTVVAVGWVPYRFGHWVWITPWGWSWVDDAPWGFAPFHYGRWVSWNNSWCWVPGPRHVHPVYAPALVGWVGGPASGAPAVFGSNVGWFPLGPREVYVPGYRVSPGYARRVNLTNTTVVNNTYITNVYGNNAAPARYLNNTTGAVTSVTRDVFISGERVGGRAIRVPAAVLAGAVAVAAAPAIVPVRQSVLGAGTRVVVRPPVALANRPVVVRTPPPRASAPFERQAAAIQANGGRALARSELAQLQPMAAAAPVRRVTAAAPAHAAVETPNLAERERILHSSPLGLDARSYSRPTAMPSAGVVRAPAEPMATAAPPPRSDRPPATYAPAPAHVSTPNDPPREYRRAVPEPAYRAPVTLPPAQHEQSHVPARPLPPAPSPRSDRPPATYSPGTAHVSTPNDPPREHSRAVPEPAYRAPVTLPPAQHEQFHAPAPPASPHEAPQPPPATAPQGASPTSRPQAAWSDPRASRTASALGPGGARSVLSTGKPGRPRA